MESILIAFIMFTFLLSLAAFFLSLNSYIETQSFKKSTHSVQYVGATKDNIKVSNSLDMEDSNLDKINKEYSEDLEKEMPWFSPSEDDKKLRSL